MVAVVKDRLEEQCRWHRRPLEYGPTIIHAPASVPRGFRFLLNAHGRLWKHDVLAAISGSSPLTVFNELREGPTIFTTYKCQGCLCVRRKSSHERSVMQVCSWNQDQDQGSRDRDGSRGALDDVWASCRQACRSSVILVIPSSLAPFHPLISPIHRLLCSWKICF